jgi:hypothetical protein
MKTHPVLNPKLTTSKSPVFDSIFIRKLHRVPVPLFTIKKFKQIYILLEVRSGFFCTNPQIRNRMLSFGTHNTAPIGQRLIRPRWAIQPSVRRTLIPTR